MLEEELFGGFSDMLTVVVCDCAQMMGVNLPVFEADSICAFIWTDELFKWNRVAASEATIGGEKRGIGEWSKSSRGSSRSAVPRFRKSASN